MPQILNEELELYLICCSTNIEFLLQENGEAILEENLNHIIKE